MNAERRLPIGAQDAILDAILPHICDFDFSQLLTLPGRIGRFAKDQGRGREAGRRAT
jgi:hypothetical protein